MNIHEDRLRNYSVGFLALVSQVGQTVHALPMRDYENRRCRSVEIELQKYVHDSNSPIFLRASFRPIVADLASRCEIVTATPVAGDERHI